MHEGSLSLSLSTEINSLEKFVDVCEDIMYLYRNICIFYVCVQEKGKKIVWETPKLLLSVSLSQLSAAVMEWHDLVDYFFYSFF